MLQNLSVNLVPKDPNGGSNHVYQSQQGTYFYHMAIIDYL